MKNILILGANGFIGKNLSYHLASMPGVNLTLFSRTISPELLKLKEHSNVTVIQGDYNDKLKLVPILKGQDIVYHLISASVPSSSWIKPELDISENLIPTLNLIALCAELEIKKVVFISSGGTVYGHQHSMVNEESPTRPFSPYGIIKLTIENFFEYFRVKNNLNYDIYRVSNPYGPEQDKLGFGVISTWLKSTIRQEPIHVFGDGNSSKDYIYIYDTILLITHSLTSDITKSGIYNISSGDISSLKKILESIELVTQKKLNIHYDSSLISDNKFVQLDNSKILHHFPGFKFTSLENGIKNTYDYLRKIY